LRGRRILEVGSWSSGRLQYERDPSRRPRLKGKVERSASQLDHGPEARKVEETNEINETCSRPLAVMPRAPESSHRVYWPSKDLLSTQCRAIEREESVI